MKNKAIPLVVALVVVGVAGATAGVVHHHDQMSANNAMMQADAMHKTDQAKAVKKATSDATMMQANKDAAMQKSDAMAATTTPAATDTMTKTGNQ